MLIERIIGCERAPSADFMTSYCFSPCSAGQLAISSQTVMCGLKPSDFLALKAKGLMAVFVASM